VLNRKKLARNRNVRSEVYDTSSEKEKEKKTGFLPGLPLEGFTGVGKAAGPQET
jgi:hypothetical protein